MILICSQEAELSTNDVMDWIWYLNYKINVVRVNVEDKISSVSSIIDTGSNKITLQVAKNHNGVKIDVSQVKSYWYRRGKIQIFHNRINNINNIGIINNINRHLLDDREYKEEYYIRSIEESANQRIGSYFTRDVNKIILMKKAANAGLEIPETIITDDRNELIRFIRKHGDVVVKPVANLFTAELDNTLYTMYTALLNESFIPSLPNDFTSSYFQQYIKKLYELRVFFLHGECFAMAIFSQTNKQTEVDFRRYDWQNPNRYVPYKLPKDIEDKICLLMNDVNLDSGSIDIIYSVDKKYYFLEVNPIGQFGMVSYPCNYFLEKKIANILIYEKK